MRRSRSGRVLFQTRGNPIDATDIATGSGACHSGFWSFCGAEHPAGGSSHHDRMHDDQRECVKHHRRQRVHRGQHRWGLYAHQCGRIGDRRTIHWVSGSTTTIGAPSLTSTSAKKCPDPTGSADKFSATVTGDTGDGIKVPGSSKGAVCRQVRGNQRPEAAQDQVIRRSTSIPARTGASSPDRTMGRQDRHTSTATGPRPQSGVLSRSSHSRTPLAGQGRLRVARARTSRCRDGGTSRWPRGSHRRRGWSGR